MKKVVCFIILSLFVGIFMGIQAVDNFTDQPDKYLDKSIKERGRLNINKGAESAILWENRNVQSSTALVALELRGLHPDSQLVHPADDFMVPAGTQWTIDSLYTEGFLEAGSPNPDSFGVIFYDNNAGMPGNEIYRENLVPGGTFPTNLEIALGTPLVLQTGTYWVSVVAIYNTGIDLTTRWNWYMDTVPVNIIGHLEDMTGIFGGGVQMSWTPFSGLGLADPSQFFAIFGEDSALSVIHDYAVNSISAPGFMIDTTTYDVTVEVENTGQLAENDAPIKLFEDGIEVSSLMLSLGAGEDSLVTFSYTPAANGDYELCAISFLPLDTITFNDTSCTAISVATAGISEVWFEDFESGVWPPAGWTEFHSGVDALDSTSARAYSPMYSAIFDDDFSVDSSWFVTPQIIDLGSDALLNFYQYQFFPTYYEYHAIWVSTGNADPASGDYVEVADLGVGAGPWEFKSVDLSAFVGEDVYIAFVYYGNFADEWQLDDIALYALPPAPLTIAQARVDNDGDFVPDLLGQIVTVQGVVTSPNNYPAWTEYVIQDATAGITLYSGGGTFHADLSIGDEVLVTGAITQYNGEADITPTDSTGIIVLSSGNPLPAVQEITIPDLGEDYESELILFNDVWLVDPSAWPAPGSYATLAFTDGVDTANMYIDPDTDIDDNPAPTGTFDLIGVGGQYTFSTPPNDGYQMQPRFYSDFILLSGLADELLDIPKEFALCQNYPNPFNPSTTIKYGLKKNVDVTLKIYNILGQEVRTLVNRSQTAGYKNVVWDGLDNNGQHVSTGVYVYRIEAGDFVKSRKMIFMK